MPRQAKELSPLEVKRLVHTGGNRNRTFAVGGVSGLLLQITPSGGRSWVLRVRVGQKRREIGLGGYPSVTLGQARDKAREIRNQVVEGIDPVEQRKALRAELAAAQRRNLTFSAAMERYFESKLDAFKNKKHRAQWQSTLRTYAEPQLGTMDVNDITVQDVLRVIEPIWRTKTETANRVRGRVEAILSWATVSGHRSGDNPASWKGNLKELLPAPSKIKDATNFPALALVDLPRWAKAVSARQGMSARALEFVVLTCARSGEARGATWDEIDLERALWTIPAQRMKAKREHRVPLSEAAVALLRRLPVMMGNPFVFPAPRGGELSDMALSQTMRRVHEADLDGGFFDEQSKRPAVPHGLRSTFRDWVSEETNYPNEMAEVALAHKISNAVEAAYRRKDMVEKRRRMMEAWSDEICPTNEGATLVSIKRTQ